MFFTKVNGIDIFYEKMGQGEPLILLHGNGETHEIFVEAAEKLAQHYTVYLPDTRGHGRSGKVEEYHYEDMARDVYCFIKVMGLEKPTVYGFSDGGITGLLLASRYPGLLKKLVVSGVNARPEDVKRPVLWMMKLSYALRRKPLVKLMLTEPNITDEQLAAIDVPVEVTAGSRDLIKQSAMLDICRKIPNATFTVFEGEDHGSYIVHSTKIADHLLGRSVFTKQSE